MISLSVIFTIFVFIIGHIQCVTIYNNIPRLDTDGNIIDCHSGNILKINDTYYMYGEHYGNNTGFGEATIPVLHVYTSTDMIAWVHRGNMINNAPSGTYFTPYVAYNQQTKYFVAWFNAYVNGCCSGNFGVAQSKDGISFEIVSLNEEPVYPGVDGNSILVDDDGNAYVFYSSLSQNHSVSIELLTPDYLHTTKKNFGLFPDGYVEGQVLFKRNGIYYAGYGSCCCFCRAGSGFVLFSSKSIMGPWTRLGVDKNCNTSTTEVCGAYGLRPSDNLIINAQGISISVIPSSDGESTYLWQAERWLSAPYNNPSCPSECQAQTGVCEEPGNYIKGHGYSYWYPLEFTDSGDVNQFSSFVDSFELNI